MNSEHKESPNKVQTDKAETNMAQAYSGALRSAYVAGLTGSDFILEDLKGSFPQWREAIQNQYVSGLAQL